MKSIKKIMVLGIIFFMHVCDCIADTQGLQNIHNNNFPLTVDNLTWLSYISPKMQWAVLSMIDKPAFFEINKYTGIAQGILTVNELLPAIELELLLSPDKVRIELLQQGLQAMLEATDIACNTVEIKAAHKDSLFVQYKTILLEDLHLQKRKIHTMYDRVCSMQKIEKLSYISWIWKNRFFSQKPSLVKNDITFNEDSSTITIPMQGVDTFIHYHDYMQADNPIDAANILCKQCLLAQQPYNKTAILLHLHAPISTTDCMYTNLPDMYNPHIRTYPLCEYIETLEHDAYAQLIYLHQAIQTAILIVQRQLNLEVIHIWKFSQFVKLRDILEELETYDAYVCALRAGQKIEIVKIPTQWSMTSKIAIAAIVAVIIGRIVYPCISNIYAPVHFPPEDKTKIQPKVDIDSSGEQPGTRGIEQTRDNSFGTQHDQQDQSSTHLEEKQDSNIVEKQIEEQVDRPINLLQQMTADVQDLQANLRDLGDRICRYVYAQYAKSNSDDEPVSGYEDPQANWGAEYDRSAKEDEQSRQASMQARRGYQERTGLLRYIFGPYNQSRDKYEESNNEEEMSPLGSADETEREILRGKAESVTYNENASASIAASNKPPRSSAQLNRSLSPIAYIGERESQLHTSSNNQFYISSPDLSPQDLKQETTASHSSTNVIESRYGKYLKEGLTHGKDVSREAILSTESSISSEGNMATDTTMAVQEKTADLDAASSIADQTKLVTQEKQNRSSIHMLNEAKIVQQRINMFETVEKKQQEEKDEQY